MCIILKGQAAAVNVMSQFEGFEVVHEACNIKIIYIFFVCAVARNNYSFIFERRLVKTAHLRVFAIDRRMIEKALQGDKDNKIATLYGFVFSPMCNSERYHCYNVRLAVNPLFLAYFNASRMEASGKQSKARKLLAFSVSPDTMRWPRERHADSSKIRLRSITFRMALALESHPPPPCVFRIASFDESGLELHKIVVSLQDLNY